MAKRFDRQLGKYTVCSCSFLFLEIAFLIIFSKIKNINFNIFVLIDFKKLHFTADKATDATLIDPNWDAIIECVDMIRAGEVP